MNTEQPTKLDEILLKPAYWRWDDYERAKHQLLDHILNLPELQTKGISDSEAFRVIYKAREAISKAILGEEQTHAND